MLGFECPAACGGGGWVLSLLLCCVCSCGLVAELRTCICLCLGSFSLCFEHAMLPSLALSSSPGHGEGSEAWGPLKALLSLALVH